MPIVGHRDGLGGIGMRMLFIAAATVTMFVLVTPSVRGAGRQRKGKPRRR
jgi:hypothetical protein